MRSPLSPQPSRASRMRLRTNWPLIGGAVIVGLLALAWFDGGETPVRQIAVPVQLPGAAR